MAYHSIATRFWALWCLANFPNLSDSKFVFSLLMTPVCHFYSSIESFYLNTVIGNNDRISWRNIAFRTINKTFWEEFIFYNIWERVLKAILLSVSYWRWCDNRGRKVGCVTQIEGWSQASWLVTVNTGKVTDSFSLNFPIGKFRIIIL